MQLLLRTVMLAFRSLLSDPNPDDPLMPDIGIQYKFNRQQFDATAKEWTQKYASRTDYT